MPGRDAAGVEAAVRDTGLLGPDRPVLVLLSGGRDSTCLLDLAVRICGAPAVSALHVNYGLRAGSVLDERHCTELCGRLEVPLSIERPLPEGRQGNLQDWARQVRYTAAQQAAGTADIAVGHTADDQLETILYRLISSPSRRALAGMAARRGSRIRPLLGIGRDETGAYCVERGLRYRDDPTNASPQYVRNRIRHELIPLIGSLHPGGARNVLALAEVLAEEGEVLAADVARVLGDRRAVALTELAALPRGLARLVLQTLADAVHGAPAAGVARRIEEVLAMGDDAKLDLPGGVRAITQGGILRLAATPPLAHCQNGRR